MLSDGVPSDSRKGKEMRDPFKDSGSADDPFVAESRDKDQAYDEKHDNDTRGQIRLLHN